MYRPSWIQSILLIRPILTLGPRPTAQVAIKSPRGTNTKDSISCVHISHSICCHFWIIFTDQVCDCMEQKTCNRSGLNFIRTCFSPWNWFILAFTMSLNMCLCTLFQTCFLPEIYPVLLSPLHQGGDKRSWWAKAGLRNFQSRNLNFFATFATNNKEVWKN